VSTQLSEAKGVTFVLLTLKDAAGKVVSRNTYWISATNDFKPLNEMGSAAVQTKVLKSEKLKSENRWTIQITNNSDKVAFFVRPQLMVDGAEVLPTFWSDSYFTLAPSETTTVTVSCPLVNINGKKPELKVSGWNVPGQVLLIN
jgi:hypothetical protein